MSAKFLQNADNTENDIEVPNKVLGTYNYPTVMFCMPLVRYCVIWRGDKWKVNLFQCILVKPIYSCLLSNLRITMFFQKYETKSTRLSKQAG